MIASNGSKKVLLLVDDDPSVRRGIHEECASFCEQILHARSGQEALKIIQTQAIDVVVCDIQMPNGNGFWLVDQLVALKIRPLFYCYYSAVSKFAIPLAKKQQVDEVFAKYSEFEELCRWVQESLE